MPQPDAQYFPICLNLADRPCIVIGGGRVAERKVMSLLEHGARVLLVSPALGEGLARLVEAGRLEWRARSYQQGDLLGAFLVIAATDDPAVQEMVHAEAESRNILLNVADVPKWCNFILPATARRGDLTVSISTAGKSPALASRLRREMEQRFGDEYAILLEILGKARELVLSQGRPHAENKVIFAALVEPDLAAWLRNGSWDQLREHFGRVLGEQVPLAFLDTVQARHSPAPGGTL